LLKRSNNKKGQDGRKKRNGIEHIKALFDQLSQDYEDVYLQSLEAKVFGYVTGKHPQGFLPNDKNAIILDAGGGTGRVDSSSCQNGIPSRWFVERSSTEHFLIRSPNRLSLLSGLFVFGPERF